jgi:hypothetical protein
MPGSRKGGVQYSKLDEAPAPAPSPAPSTVAVAVVVVVVVAGGAGARHGRWPVDGDGLWAGAGAKRVLPIAQAFEQSTWPNIAAYNT